jgi:hypothetical protein
VTILDEGFWELGFKYIGFGLGLLIDRLLALLNEELRLGRGWIENCSTRLYTPTIIAQDYNRRYAQNLCIAIIPDLYTNKPNGFIYNLGTRSGLPGIPMYIYYNMSVRSMRIIPTLAARAFPDLPRGVSDYALFP